MNAVQKQTLGMKLQLPKNTELRSKAGSESHHIQLKNLLLGDFLLRHGNLSNLQEYGLPGCSQEKKMHHLNEKIHALKTTQILHLYHIK